MALAPATANGDPEVAVGVVYRACLNWLAGNGGKLLEPEDVVAASSAN